MYSIQAHDGAVSSVTYSASYVITVGADERICVWERFQGHLLNTIILVRFIYIIFSSFIGNIQFENKLYKNYIKMKFFY